jgi:energy-converting hydrogenase B subunit C
LSLLDALVSKLEWLVILYIAGAAAALYALVNIYSVALSVALPVVAKVTAAIIMLFGSVFLVCASVGFWRFGDEWGRHIFYARNHICGIIDDTCALVMIIVGVLIGRIDLAAIGFFFFVLIPFVGNALANAYYHNTEVSK